MTRVWLDPIWVGMIVVIAATATLAGWVGTRVLGATIVAGIVVVGLQTLSHARRARE